MAGLSTFSDFMGYTSIACWLGAQFPQILENIKRQSCEGLALPFLANWALGDISNLIGCILTHQLPFQTYLATYFVFVDMTLVAQYFYYRQKPAILPYRRLSRARAASEAARRMSVDRITPRYRTLSAVAANVAAVAALAAQQNEQAEVRHPHTRWPTGHNDEPSGSHLPVDAAGDDADQDATAMTESFHSDAGSTRRKRISWSTESYSRRAGSASRSPLQSLLPALQITATEPAVVPDDILDRGRSLQRESSDTGGEISTADAGRGGSRGASRRGAGMVFLAVWALFGIGMLPGTKTGLFSTHHTDVGKVLAVVSTSIPHVPLATSDALLGVGSASLFSTQIVRHTRSLDTNEQPLSTLPPHDEPPPTFPATERILGRIFAWLCTTLYLTSRLPQIWKNFIRKSVEGLSMYLFIFAFFGNVFYVVSILSSSKMSLPPPESSAFIKESIPYLLGSGGTLMFDITIVSQSFIYRPRTHHHRGRSTRSRHLDEEAAGLLAGDSLVPPSLGSSGLSQHGLATNESVAQARSRTAGARNDLSA